MVNYTLLGSKGTGKTEEAKQILSRANVQFAFDYQNSGDYDHMEDYDPDKFQLKCRLKRRMKHPNGKTVDYDYRDFMRIVENEYFGIGATVLLEESKGMFKGNGIDNQVNQFLIDCRHNLVNFVFLFHSADQMPPFIRTFTDWLILKRTDGGDSHLKNKFDNEVYKLSLECRNDIRKTYIVGTSNLTAGEVHLEYFEGKTLRDKVEDGTILEEAIRKMKK